MLPNRLLAIIALHGQHCIFSLNLDAPAEPFWQTSVPRLELLYPHL